MNIYSGSTIPDFRRHVTILSSVPLRGIDIVTCTQVSRQRVGKQVPRRQILGKQSVAGLRNSRGGCVFYVVRATPGAGNGPMNSQSVTWHVFLWGPYQRIIRDSSRNMTLTRRQSRESFSWISRFQDIWRREDFIVIWSASFCVEIRCQETTSEDWESWCVCSGGLESV
jgi:hypothetical protein